MQIVPGPQPKVVRVLRRRPQIPAAAMIVNAPSSDVPMSPGEWELFHHDIVFAGAPNETSPRLNDFA